MIRTYAMVSGMRGRHSPDARARPRSTDLCESMIDRSARGLWAELIWVSANRRDAESREDCVTDLGTVEFEGRQWRRLLEPAKAASLFETHLAKPWRTCQ